MSKSKEECLRIIDKNLNNFKEEKTSQEQFLLLEKIISEISSAEYGKIYLLDSENNKIISFFTENNKSLVLENSILKTVIFSKKNFFKKEIFQENNYNKKIDNPLNKKIKSMMLIPILDQAKVSVLGCISVYTTFEYPDDLKRYDFRSLSLLENHIRKAINIFNSNKLVKKEELKENILDFEEELRQKDNKIKKLEEEILLQTKLLKITEESTKLIVTKKSNESTNEITIILNFLMNEVSYLANEEHKLYLFLEIIKNSLHNKKQLSFLNNQLENAKFIEKLATDLYVRDKMPVLIKKFSIYQLINDVGHFYSELLAYHNITLNIFINPYISMVLISDKEKLKSIIIHLMNNIFNYINNTEAIELNIDFLKENNLLSFEIKGCNKKIKKRNKIFFTEGTSHSLISSDRGLGLSVSSNLINILGGKLKLSTSMDNEHSFLVLIPTQDVKEKEKLFFFKKEIKILIIMGSEHHYAYQNLLRSLLSLGVEQKWILTFKNLKSVVKIKSSHLFCFESMLTEKFDFKKTDSLTVLRYSRLTFDSKKINKNKVNILYVNSYYGLTLQEIIFPNIASIKLKNRTLVVEDSFLSKFNAMVHKLKFS